jgi:hypothetical protein
MEGSLVTGTATMPIGELSSAVPPLPRPAVRSPRRPYQEVADLLATALLRLRQRNAASAVGLAFADAQSVNANPSPPEGVR